MTHTIRTLTFSACSAALLAGCVGASDKYPSLAIRDAERQTGQFIPAAPQQLPAPSPATFEQLRGFVERARTAHQQFTAEQPAALRLARAARGSGVEDDRRARALVAVAALTSLHGQTSLALTDLDQLEFLAASEFEATDDIKAAQILVGQMIQEQDAALDSFDAAMAR